VNLEQTLRETIQELDRASFSKTSLKFFKEIPKTTSLVLKTSSSNDNEKLLAVQVYGKFFEKLGSFSKEIKAKKIVPNKEELNESKEVIDIVYESNKELLNTAPEIASAIKINEIQPVLSDLKLAIQQMKNEVPPDSSGDKLPLT